MSEIEKLYARAMIEPLSITVCGVDEQIINYPPFTAEKQLELLLFCTIWGQVHIIKGIDNEYRIENCCYRYGYQPTIAEAIANHLNEKWHILTAEQQEQIRSILNG